MLTKEQLDEIIDGNNLLGDVASTTTTLSSPTTGLRGSALLQSLKTTTPVEQPIAPVEKQGFFSRLGTRFKDSITEQAEIVKKQDEGKINKLAESIGVAGVGANLIAETGFDIVASGAKKLFSLLPDDIEDEAKRAVVEKAQDFFNTESGKSVLEMVNAGETSFKKIEEISPSTAEVLKGAFRIAELIPAKKGTDITAKGIKSGKELVEQISKPRIIAKSKAEIDTLVGRITQGTKEEVLSASRALKQVDTSNVETFADLKQLASDSISSIAKKQDEVLDAVYTVRTIESFTKKVGNKEQNFVKRGIEQLKEFYDKTEDLDGLSKLEDLESKFLKEGITAKEINSLSREYSSNMPNAFSKTTGEPLTSINKVAVENTRKGLKDASRSLLPDDTSKLLDSEMSDLFALKRTTEKMEKTVHKLQNKIKKRGLLEKLAKKAGVAVDIATFGTVRGFLTSFLPSNIGNKVLNSLDVEGALMKNLKKLDILNARIDKLSDDNAISALSGLIKNK